MVWDAALTASLTRIWRIPFMLKIVVIMSEKLPHMRNKDRRIKPFRFPRKWSHKSKDWNCHSCSLQILHVISRCCPIRCNRDTKARSLSMVALIETEAKDLMPQWRIRRVSTWTKASPNSFCLVTNSISKTSARILAWLRANTENQPILLLAGMFHLKPKAKRWLRNLNLPKN